MDFLASIFDTTDFPARWKCGRWTAEHGWLHIISDLGVWSAYVAIPCVLGYFFWRRKDLPFRAIFLLFAAFILACGSTHLMEAAIFWWPAYRFAGVIKLFTAVVSWATVFALIPIVPRAMAMRTPAELELEIGARKSAEAALIRANDELERRVAERTSELVQANATLQLEREQFRTTLASIGDAVIATDTEGRVTFLNSVAQDLTGWSDVEAKGQPLEQVFRIISEKTRQTVENPAIRAQRDDVIVGLANHTLLINRDGSERPIDDSAAPIRCAEGEVVGCVLVFRDVTQRREAEDSLRESEERLRLAQRIAKIGTFDWNIQTGVNQWTPELEAMYGLPPGGFAGTQKTWEELVHPEDRQHAIRRVAEALRGGEFSDEWRVIWPDGSTRWLAGRASLFKDEAGMPLRLIGINIDVTEQKQAEAALRDADQRKDEFLATLSHELRNPLAPLRNALSILKLTNNDQGTREQTMQIMDRQLSHMVRLIDDLLDVSRISRGKLELRRGRVELASIIHQAIETCRPLLDNARHDLKIQLPDQAIYLEADAIRLAQVFSNLLNNACKFTEPGGRIELSAERQGSDVVVSIADDGIGIPGDKMSGIFEMFSQVDRGLNRSYGGLGIGLTLVKRLVELHDGTVEAHSEGLESGSKFIVRLPIIVGQTVSEPDSGPESDLSQQKRRILVVDDNYDSAESLAMLLKLSGNETHMAHDGEQAVLQAEQLRPDVILLDIGLPLLNGYDACRRIRSFPWAANVIIVALTGWGQEEDRRKSSEAGFNGHLVKPVKYATLMKLLADLVPANPQM